MKAEFLNMTQVLEHQRQLASQIHWQTVSGGILKGLRYSDNSIAIAQKPNQAIS